MPYRDVTPLLRVNTEAVETDTVMRAAELIGEGRHAEVSDDAYAVEVLVELGMPRDEARATVADAHGPFRDRAPQTT